MFGIPIKTVSNPRGLFTPEECYCMLTDMYSFVYLK